MEILITIMWYLALLLPGQEYTYTDIQTIADQNQPIIQQVQSNPDQMDAALNYYNGTFDDSNVGILEEWDENPIKQIPD